MSAMLWTPPNVSQQLHRTARYGAGAEREAEALRKLNAPRWPESRPRPHPEIGHALDSSQRLSTATPHSQVWGGCRKGSGGAPQAECAAMARKPPAAAPRDRPCFGLLPTSLNSDTAQPGMGRVQKGKRRRSAS